MIARDAGVDRKWDRGIKMSGGFGIFAETKYICDIVMYTKQDSI
jgi:hypothetical protein